MRNYSILLLIFVFALSAFAQKKDEKDKATTTTATVAISKTSTPMELAKAALAAHGGDKLKNMKTLIVRGTSEVSGSPTQTLSGTFAMIFSGEKYRFDLTALPVLTFRQVYDGEQTNSSLRGIMLPPLNRMGLPLLPKIEEKGFVVAVLPEKFKKKMGFRITSPEGYYTDFVIDEKTNLIKDYESSYVYGETTVTTSVAIDKYKEINGIFINENFSQRLEMGQITSYASFKAKEILIDNPVADDVFTMK